MNRLLALVLAMTITSAYGAELPPCPASPNCVSSQAEGKHRIAAFVIKGEPDQAFKCLHTLLAKRSDTTVIAADSDLIKVEFRTLLGFVDDGLFLLDRHQAVIHLRSAARLGYWDLGKNRRRMEQIRQQFSQVCQS
ncbi:MAG: DUF1499 domain-containing protein [Trichlorobacter sp.]|uniref:DUF1499 domain-containing protein n=1 Tax=Trichlorobacter sp. TaxID=2911007 RepID=UPI00256414B6|nr:DUF1499 domain-containing protein [Trichlorobacter sp.]MDK9718509.1 DUF1499 domain-containing protein [Trichlorobacter sp.]